MAARDQPNVLPPGVDDMLDVPAGHDRERMKELEGIKAQANGKFKEGDFFTAKCLYSAALEMLERCCLHMDQADTVWEGLKNNMAFCDLKREEWTRVVEATTEILQRNPKNLKALYRRGAARFGQGKLQDAKTDFHSVLAIDPTNVDARARLTELTRQAKDTRAEEKEQSAKMRGFLSGERLNEVVPITEDGGVWKAHSNEHAPLLAPWIKREWLAPQSGKAACVTCHIVMKTAAGKEIFSSRKFPGQDGGKSTSRAAEPVRFPIEDRFGLVFKAWNAAAKCLRIHEIGRFEVAKHALGPSVESAIARVAKRWLQEFSENAPGYQELPPDTKAAAMRKQALAILGLPEEFCLEPATDLDATLNMEMELLQVDEYDDLDGDGLRLLQVLRNGKPRSADSPIVTNFSTVKVHFRVAKMLLNYALKDSRMGLVSGADGITMQVDPSRDPVELVVGEEDACSDEDFAPPIIGELLRSIPGGVTEGTHLELILRDGIPASQLEQAVHKAFISGTMQGLPDTSGPAIVRIEVHQVSPPCLGPGTSSWQGIPSMQQERQRAEELEGMQEGRFSQKSLRRWRRIIVWLEQLLEGRRWKVDSGQRPSNAMYDFDWDDEDSDGKVKAPTFPAPCKEPSLLEPEVELLRELNPEELLEWAAAHAAAARLLQASEPGLACRHAACAVQGCELGTVTNTVECSARDSLAAGLADQGKTAEALECLRKALELDPTSSKLKDQAARISQRNSERQTADVKSALRSLKGDLASCLEASDQESLLMLLKEVNELPLTWEAVSETAIGKEVGKCAKVSDEAVSAQAKAIIGKLHALAKSSRPMWVR